MTATIGTELENYILDSEIGPGDLTTVYQGHRKSDSSIVAIKVVAPQFTFDELFVRRFLDMAKQASRLEHPNIVRTYEAKKEDDTLFLVRELAETRPLAEVLKEEEVFSPRRTLSIAGQISAALDYAHQKSIMHGDLSVNRIYLGKNDHVLVADFGQTQAMAGTSLVKQGFAVGSPEVMAPERVHGQGPSRQSDLYSLGILCYQMLNGEPPFVGEPAAVLHAQGYEQPRPLHMVNPGVSLRLSEAIGRMLSKGLELRYTTGSEFTRALTVAAEGTSPVRVSSAVTGKLDAGINSPRPIWARPWMWALIAIPIIFLLLIAGFAGVSIWLALQPAPSAFSDFKSDTPPPIVTEIPPPTTPSTLEGSKDTQIAAAEPTATQTLLPVKTPTTGPTPSPTAVPSPTATPTLVALPTPGPPTVADGSPFSNIKLAHGISADEQPENVGTSFAPGGQPDLSVF